jgi:hypothetical protein
MKYVLPGDMYQAYQKCYMQILSQNTKINSQGLFLQYCSKVVGFTTSCAISADHH